LTTTSPILGLKLYNLVADSASLVYNWMSDVSGSAPSNMTKIDTYVGNTSASLSDMIGISFITLSSSSSLSSERVLKNGTATTLSSSASEVSVDAVLATVAQVTTGSANAAVISASALSSSDYGKRTVCIPLNTTSVLLGSESAYIRIPSSMNNWKLVDVVATSGSSTSGSPAFRVAACPLNALSGSQNMLTTNPIIGQVAYDSSTGTGSTAAVVNVSHAVVSTGTKVWVYSASASTCGSQVLWSEVHLTFQNTQ
jgi:hypothetical protein